MNKFYLFIIILLGANVKMAFADSITAQITPLDPLRGENFYLDIDVETKSDEEPYITFDKGFAEVLGRSMQGVSLNSTLINGRLTTKRVVKYRYELTSSRAGILRISKIKALIGGEQILGDDVKVEIAKARKQAPNLFLKTVLSKNKAYIGEGITVNYYLYSRVPIIDTEIKRFPKLNNFIKRFHLPNGSKERVQFDNKLYTREIKYSARVFPEKAGKLKLDPLQILTRFETVSRQSNFGFFPFHSRRSSTRSLSSSPVTIEILPLPSIGMPSNFSGLVGKHEFRLHMPRNRFLVNEPIEYSLEVKGPGNLESLEEIKLINHKELEYFDSKVDFSEVDKINAKKVFEYTALGRQAFSLPKNNYKISYFNPQSEKFEFHVLKVLEIIVGGAVQVASGSKNNLQSNNLNKSETINTSRSEEKKDKSKEKFTGVLAPEFKFGSSKANLVKGFNYFLALILVVVLITVLFDIKITPKTDLEIKHLVGSIKKDGPSYKLVYPLVKKLGPDTNGGLEKILKESRLSNDAKSYFASLINTAEKSDYDMGEFKMDVKFSTRHFNELEKEIRRVDGNIKES